MDFTNPYATVDVAIIDLMRNMGIGLFLAVVWAFVISKTTRLIVDTRQYLPVFLLLIPSMILIITIIKSSIALSLGLVGALSIVRFRTPIKEPEELLYLFVAIAVGLGLGANQLFATLVGFTTICLGLIPAGILNSRKVHGKSTFIDIIVSSGPDGFDIKNVETILQGLSLNYDVKRVDSGSSSTELLLEVTNFRMTDFSTVQKALVSLGKDVKVIATENARIIT